MALTSCGTINFSRMTLPWSYFYTVMVW